MKKRVLSALLVLCLACGLVSTAWAADGQATPETAAVSVTDAASGETADAADYPARTVEQTVPGTDVTVQVDVPAGALPEDAKLTTALVGSSEDAADDQAVADVANELDKAEVKYDGFVALDISFVDADGNKVEPLQPVSVNFTLPAELLPEDVDASTLEVQHLEENAAGEVENVETVADTADATEGTVTVDGAAATLSEDADTALPADAEVKAEFEVDGFSTFTITWNANNAHSREFTITCYDADTRQPLSNNLSPEDLILGTGNEFVFNAENTKLELANYAVESARIRVGNGETQELYSIKATYDWNGGYYTYTYKTSANGPEQTFSGVQNVTISVYYKRVSEEATGNLSIDGSNIADTGAITAAYSGTLPQGAYYKWYRQLADGTWQQVSGQVGDSLEIYRDGARVTYKVELWQLNGTQAVDESAPFQVPYYNQLQNGSFEDTPVSGSNLQFTNGLYPEMVWQTTGLGALNSQKQADGQDIEIVNASALQNNSDNPYGVTDARAGNQLAELNCEYEGALYQDVLTAPGVDLTWWASHRARNLEYGNHDAEDTMYVVIMDAEVAAQYVTTQNQIDQIVQVAQQEGLREGKDGTTAGSITINRNYGGESVPVTVWKITSGINETEEWVGGDWWNPWDKGHYEYTETNGGWYDYTDTYKVPEGQYLTRFFFAAGDTSTDDRTVGNLLDRVGFSQYPPTPDNEGAIAITKTVTGVDVDATIAAGAYSFTVNDQTVSLPTRDAVPTDTSAWTTTVNLTPGTYTVTETDPNGLVGSEDYQYSGTFSNYNGSVTSGLTSSEILVTNGNTSSVTFNNTYAPTTTNVTITKTITGLEGADLQTLVGQLGFTLTNVSEESKTYTANLNGVEPGPDGVYTVKIEGVELGTYKVTEQNATVEGYDVSTTGLTDSLEVAIGGSNTVAITNAYTRDNNDLKITKEVKGEGVSVANTDVADKQFTFEIAAPSTIDTSKLAGSFTVENATSNNISFNAERKATVTMTGAKTVTIKGLPNGEYTVTETGSPADLETAYYARNNGTQSATVSADTAGEVTITNTYKPYLMLDITKSVTGEMGSSEDYFDFTLTGVDSDQYKLEQDQESEDANFKLNNGSTVTLTGLKPGDIVTISETTANGYTAKGITIAEGSALTEEAFSNQTTTSVTITIPEGNAANLGTVIFTNHREAVAPTGLESNHTTPYVLMITAAGMAGLALIGGIVARRIRRRRQE